MEHMNLFGKLLSISKAPGHNSLQGAILQRTIFYSKIKLNMTQNIENYTIIGYILWSAYISSIYIECLC